MVAGLRVTNSHGSVQIDENWKNLVLRKKASASRSGDRFTCTFNGGVNPILALRSSYPVCVLEVTRSGNDYSWLCNVDGSPSSVQYYVFDSQPNVMPSWGLVVKNASNQVVYSATEKPLRIVDAIYSTMDQNSNPKNYSYPSGRTYATIWGKGSKVITGGPGPGPGGMTSQIWQSCAKVSGDTVTISIDLVDSYTGAPSAGYNSTKFQCLVIDVTNY